jgi:hypothetical protein
MTPLATLLLLIAGVLSAIPILWLAIFTYTAIGHISFYGLFDYFSAGSLLPAIGVWMGVISAVIFARSALVSRRIASLRSPFIIAGLFLGLIGGTAIEIMVWDNPKVGFPITFFSWPMFCFVLLGLIAPMLPNPGLHTDARDGVARR